MIADLHESSGFDRGGRLKAGMVVTIEPGVYVPPMAQFPKHFHGLGVRIEDEVLVGKEHATVLSVSAPKEVSCAILAYARVDGYRLRTWREHVRAY